MAKTELPTANDYHPYGNTCPLLKIAQQHEVPYELTLGLADYQQHGRPVTPLVREMLNSMSRSRADRLRIAVQWVSRHTIDLRAGLATL